MSAGSIFCTFSVERQNWTTVYLCSHLLKTWLQRTEKFLEYVDYSDVNIVHYHLQLICPPASQTKTVTFWKSNLKAQVAPTDPIIARRVNTPSKFSISMFFIVSFSAPSVATAPFAHREIFLATPLEMFTLVWCNYCSLSLIRTDSQTVMS